MRATAVDNRLPDGRLAEDFAGFLEEHRGLRGIALGAGARVLLAGNCTVSVGDGRAAIRERN
ncbi:hypothetical protein HS125_04300 [bacterium]|nr:hypothetical protein [bacterium]